MPALVAKRFIPDLQAIYSQLRAAGKPAKIAIVAIMRKLLETANTLVKADRFWVEKEPLRTTDTPGWFGNTEMGWVLSSGKAIRPPYSPQAKSL